MEMIDSAEDVVTLTTWQFEPGVGIGPFRLGMSDAEIDAIAGQRETIRADAGNGGRTELVDGSVIVSLTHDRLVGVQVAPDVTVVYDGIRLNQRLVSEVVDELRTRGHVAEIDEEGATCMELGLELWTEDRGDGPVETVGVGRNL